LSHIKHINIIHERGRRKRDSLIEDRLVVLIDAHLLQLLLGNALEPPLILALNLLVRLVVVFELGKTLLVDPAQPPLAAVLDRLFLLLGRVSLLWSRL
jgi:hypothetical protein